MDAYPEIITFPRSARLRWTADTYPGHDPEADLSMTPRMKEIRLNALGGLIAVFEEGLRTGQNIIID